MIHVANTLDDTQLTKKKILHESLKVVDDQIGDKNFQNSMISALLPLSKDKDTLRNTCLTPEDIECLSTLSAMTSSKKDSETRAQELFKIVQKPLETFFEEKLQYYLQDIREQPVLRALCQAICYCKFVSNL